MIMMLPETGVVAVVLINATDKNPLAEKFAGDLLQVKEPAFQPLTFDVAGGFEKFSAQPRFLGGWEGVLMVDGHDLLCALSFSMGGNARLEFPGRPATELLADKIPFTALVCGDDLVATLPGTLPAQDVIQEPGGYVLLRLVLRDDKLTGAFVAYASPEGLKHLYPFAVSLRKVSSSTEPNK